MQKMRFHTVAASEFHLKPQQWDNKKDTCLSVLFCLVWFISSGDRNFGYLWGSGTFPLRGWRWAKVLGKGPGLQRVPDCLIHNCVHWSGDLPSVAWNSSSGSLVTRCALRRPPLGLCPTLIRNLTLKRSVLLALGLWQSHCPPKYWALTFLVIQTTGGKKKDLKCPSIQSFLL